MNDAQACVVHTENTDPRQGHTRKLVREYRADGTRVVEDERLRGPFGRSARLLSKLPTRRRPRKQ